MVGAHLQRAQLRRVLAHDGVVAREVVVLRLDVRQVDERRLGDRLVGLAEHALAEHEARLPAVERGARRAQVGDDVAHVALVVERGVLAKALGGRGAAGGAVAAGAASAASAAAARRARARRRRRAADRAPADEERERRVVLQPDRRGDLLDGLEHRRAEAEADLLERLVEEEDERRERAAGEVRRDLLGVGQLLDGARGLKTGCERRGSMRQGSGRSEV